LVEADGFLTPLIGIASGDLELKQWELGDRRLMIAGNIRGRNKWAAAKAHQAYSVVGVDP
jgi:hypothetical protein